ncbi:MAG: hypothetical protein KY475_09275, partial [Planctomycetes bacterium]|nr:hypothetical protein [Planctomycetota bacterium]
QVAPRFWQTYQNGRILDNEHMQLKSAIREVCRTLHPGIRLTPHQSIIFTDIEEGRKGELEEILRRHNVTLSEDVSTVRRWSMACVAWPTCGLAVTESERALPPMIDELEVELARLGLSNEKFTVRMTGCPNGCARPYNSDVGLVGKTVGKYTVFLGGRLLGNRMNFLYKDLVPAAEVVPTLVPPLVYFKQARHEGESFGDFCDRIGKDGLLKFAEEFAARERETASDSRSEEAPATPEPRPQAASAAEAPASGNGSVSNGAPLSSSRRIVESRSQADELTTLVSENQYLKLTLDRDPSLYSGEEQRRFLAALENLLQISPVVLHRQPGTVKLNVKLSAEEIERLLLAAKEVEEK